VFQNGALVQLQIIHLLDLQYNVLLTSGPSAIAEPLLPFRFFVFVFGYVEQ